MSNTFCSDIVSDLYKDAYGFRPGLSFIETWNEMSDAEKLDALQQKFNLR